VAHEGGGEKVVPKIQRRKISIGHFLSAICDLPFAIGYRPSAFGYRQFEI
jgi:hypothetical protein